MKKFKKCPKCKSCKGISEFGSNASKKDGLQSWCKGCRRDHKNVDKTKSQQRSWYLVNRERLLDKAALYRKANQHRIQEVKAKIHYERLNNDVEYRIACNLRSRLYSAIKNNQKSGSAVRDLGCSIGELKLYLENQFESGMTWDNYGEWHIDHVIPLSHFNLLDRMEFLEAVNWLNLQPMWAKDNLSKHARLNRGV